MVELVVVLVIGGIMGSAMAVFGARAMQGYRDLIRRATLIDATEGGVAKQHVTNQPLREVLDQHATQPLPTIPIPSLEHDSERVALARTRIGQVRKSIAQLREVSTRTIPLLRNMLHDQHDPKKMVDQYLLYLPVPIGAHLVSGLKQKF